MNDWLNDWLNERMNELVSKTCFKLKLWYCQYKKHLGIIISF